MGYMEPTDHAYTKLGEDNLDHFGAKSSRCCDALIILAQCYVINLLND